MSHNLRMGQLRRFTTTIDWMEITAGDKFLVRSWDRVGTTDTPCAELILANGKPRRIRIIFLMEYSDPI